MVRLTFFLGRAFTFPGGGIVAFAFLPDCSWRTVSILIPGGGVVPGLIGVLTSPTPGGVAFVTTFVFPGGGMPGVLFADGVIGLVDISGGSSFALTCRTTCLFALVLAVFELVSAAPPQAPTIVEATAIINIFFMGE